MSRIFISGSADGLGLMAGQLLAEQGHQVTLHARSEARGTHARKQLPAAEKVVIGDVSTLAAMRDVAAQANATGRFDAVIHNVAIGYRERRRVVTVDGVEQIFAVNVLAPYVLTALIPQPRRLVYLSSGLHRSGTADLADPQWEKRAWNGMQAYSDSKLFDVVLANAVARRWPGTSANAVEPGWVATKMGGKDAPDDLSLGAVTQAWLAVSDDAAALVSGKNLHHQKLRDVHPRALDIAFQDALIAYCESLSGVAIPPPLLR